MLTVEQSEAIRRAYFVDDKSVRAIDRELHHGRRAIREVLAGDRRLTAALLDRLTFHAHLLQFTGERFRLRQSLKRQEQQRRHG
jgi:hypothetical protein